MDDNALAAWRETVNREMEIWRKDPNYCPVLPPCPGPSDLVREQRLIMLEERLTGLEKVSDQNTAVFSDSLQFAELCIQALQRALDDMVAGSLKTLDAVEAPSVVEVAGETVSRGTAEAAVRALHQALSAAPARRVVDFKAYLNAALQQRLRKEAPVAPEPASEQTSFEFGG